MKKMIFVILDIFLLCLLISLFSLAYKSWKIQSENGSFEGTATTGGQVAEGIVIDSFTGLVEDVEPTEFDKYKSFVDLGNYRSFFPGYQGTLKGSYSSNTELMNQYLAKNTFQFNLPKIPTNGYLYIRLKNPTTNTVFVYFHNTKINGYTVSGDLDKDKSLIESDSEMLFKLDDISYIPYHKKNAESFDWQSKMKQGNNNYIAGFVRDYNGANKIEEITIAWE